MTSHYRNTNSIAYLLLCLFITYASASSLIRQFTDDFTTNLQQEKGAGPISNLDERKYQEVTSRDQEVSDYKVKGLRNRAPSSYSLKMESFNTLLEATTEQRYVSRPFSVGGYNWTLVVYPNGNEKDNGTGYLSLYVTIHKSTPVPAGQDVYADLRFYVFNKKVKKYFTIQDTDVWRFNVFNKMWGFSRVLPVDTFKDPENGYLYDGDHCEFGVDVTRPSRFETSELFTVTKNFPNPRFTWTIRKFSTLLKVNYFSDEFSIGERKFVLQVSPNGPASGEGKFLSVYLVVAKSQTTELYERTYVRTKIRVLNQRQLDNFEREFGTWYERGAYALGYRDYMPLADLRDSSKGFLVNDVLIVQLEKLAISSTKFFP